MASKKVFEVTLKLGHPTGTYRRGGHIFHASEPTMLETVPDLVRKDPWLVVKAIDAPAKEKAQEGDKGKQSWN